MMNHLSRVPHHALFPRFGACVLLVLLGAITADAATYYVATTGNDSNPGTLSQPFKTFEQGVNMLQPGDTLSIRGGVYTETLDTGTKVGTAEKYITIAAYPGETVTLQPPSLPKCKYAIVPRTMNYMILDGLVWDGSAGCLAPYGLRIVEGTHHLIVQNMEIKNVKSHGILLGNVDNIIIRNNKIHDQVSPTGQSGQRMYGIYFHHGTNSVIEGNDIYNNPGGGIHAYPGPISNLTIKNNKLHHNNFLDSSTVEGILVFQYGNTRISGVRIYNNLVYHNGANKPGTSRSGGIAVANEAIGTKVWNNTIYGNKGWGIRTIGTTDSVVQNNIVFANTFGQIWDNGQGSILSNNLTTDPKFLSADDFDFRLQANSPAIGNGVVLNEVPTDIRGRPRLKVGTDDRYDMGAYAEDVSDFTGPAPPKRLSVR